MSGDHNFNADCDPASLGMMAMSSKYRDWHI